MKEELREKWEDFVILVISIFLDALLVLIVGGLIFGVKYILEEWVFHCKIEESKNDALIIIYSMSKIFLIVAFFLYIIWDVISQVIKIAKRIRK